MKISVLIPTYRRPDSLRRCLDGLGTQLRPADQVLVVVREGDEASREAARERLAQLPVQVLEIDRPGVIQALNLGMVHVQGDVVVITDDDTEAPPDWLRKIEQHYLADRKLGGLGGRDAVHEHGAVVPATQPLVGKVLPFGRIVGNHHIGIGPPREVDHLKGANMSWRMRAIEGLAFDTELRGAGAQVFFELACSLQVKHRGWRLLYDPAVCVNHFPAARFDSDKRGQPALDAIANATFNLYYSLRRYLQPAPKRWAALNWARFIGTHHQPGLVRGLLSHLRRDAWGITLRRATAQAWRDAQKAAEAHAPSTQVSNRNP